MQAVLDEAIEQYRRDTFFGDLDESYARLRADPKAWKRDLAERREWNITPLDRGRGKRPSRRIGSQPALASSRF